MIHRNIADRKKAANQYIKLIFGRVAFRTNPPILPKPAVFIDSQNRVGIPNINDQKHSIHLMCRVKVSVVQFKGSTS
jgi:hypothetical protein